MKQNQIFIAVLEAETLQKLQYKMLNMGTMATIGRFLIGEDGRAFWGYLEDKR